MPWKAVVAPEVSFPHSSLSILLCQHRLLTFPLLLQFLLVHPEPGVWDLLTAAGKASPPADALSSSEAEPGHGLAPLAASCFGGFFPRYTAGELLQRSAQRHEGIHFQSLRRVDFLSVGLCDASRPVQLSSLCIRAACPVDESVVPLLCLDLETVQLMTLLVSK